jgi:hypothetical protein
VTEGVVTEGVVTEGVVTEGVVTEGVVTEGVVTEGVVTEGGAAGEIDSSTGVCANALAERSNPNAAEATPRRFRGQLMTELNGLRQGESRTDVAIQSGL